MVKISVGQFNDSFGQRGFTLVELLVGLVVSLFIIGVTITYMTTSSRAFRVQTNESLIQENARFALEVLTQNFRLAGLNPSNNFDNDLAFLYVDANCADGEAGLTDGGAGSAACTRDGAFDNTENNSDRIAIDYMVDASKSGTDLIVNGCNGAAITVPSGTEVRLANIFWSGDIDGDQVRSLYCQTFNVSTSQAEGAALPLVDGVDRLQFQYGVDADNDGIIERYQSLTNLGMANTTIIRSIRVAMLLNGGAGEDQNLDTEDNINRTYTLLDAPSSSFSDRELRQVYSTTVLIPNNLNRI